MQVDATKPNLGKTLPKDEFKRLVMQMLVEHDGDYVKAAAELNTEDYRIKSVSYPAW